MNLNKKVKYRETRIPIKRGEAGQYEKAGEPEAFECEVTGRSARKIAETIKGLPSLQLYELKKTGMTVIMSDAFLTRIELIGHEKLQETKG